jgi:hypothetical protein
LRWYDFAPEVLVLGGLTLFAVTEPHAATSGLKSVKALVLITVVTLVWLAARVLTAYAVRWPWARIAIFTIGALALLKVVVFPAYDNHTVVEALPSAVPATTSVPSSTSNPGPPTSASGPTKIRDGELVGIDHRAMGTVSLYRTPEGRVLVGLEEFDIQPGPAYVLYLVPGADREDLGGATRLESLRGNRGTQYYETETTADTIAAELTVLVWCETFDVPVARATPVAV